VVGVGLVHDRNASEVSEPSTDERTGTTTRTQTYFCRLIRIQIQLISSFFKVIQAYSKQKNDLIVPKARKVSSSVPPFRFSAYRTCQGVKMERPAHGLPAPRWTIVGVLQVL
jgi:hypothetical protein